MPKHQKTNALPSLGGAFPAQRCQRAVRECCTSRWQIIMHGQPTPGQGMVCRFATAAPKRFASTVLPAAGTDLLAPSPVGWLHPQHPHPAPHPQAQNTVCSKPREQQSGVTALPKLTNAAKLLRSIHQTRWVMEIRPAAVQTTGLKRREAKATCSGL